MTIAVESAVAPEQGRADELGGSLRAELAASEERLAGEVSSLAAELGEG